MFAGKVGAYYEVITYGRDITLVPEAVCGGFLLFENFKKLPNIQFS
jgi:hypothetical protein